MRPPIIILLITILLIALVSGCDEVRTDIAEYITPPTQTETIQEENETIKIIEEENETIKIADSQAFSDYIIHFINLPEGEAILIQNNIHPTHLHKIKKTSYALIDCGGLQSHNELIKYLKNEGVKDISFLVASTVSREDVGGCDDIMLNFNVGEIYVVQKHASSGVWSSFKQQWNGREKIAKEGENIMLGDLKIETLFTGIKEYSDENERSIVLKGYFNDKTVLFTGNCYRKCEEVLIENKFLNVDFVKIPHHCHRLGSGYDFIAETSPLTAFSISGSKNTQNYPQYECERRWKIHKTRFYDTKKEGTIKLFIDKTDGWWIETEK